MGPMTADAAAEQSCRLRQANTTVLTRRHEMIVERQLGRQLALQALFEIDSVGHLPGDVVDARLANPMPVRATRTQM